MKHKQEKKFYQDVIKKIDEVNQKLTKAQKNYEVIGNAYSKVEQEYIRFGAITEDVKRLGIQQKSLVLNYVKLVGKHNALLEQLILMQGRHPHIFEGINLEVLRDESINTGRKTSTDKPEPVPSEKPVHEKPVEAVHKVGQE